MTIIHKHNIPVLCLHDEHNWYGVKEQIIPNHRVTFTIFVRVRVWLVFGIALCSQFSIQIIPLCKNLLFLILLMWYIKKNVDKIVIRWNRIWTFAYTKAVIRRCKSEVKQTNDQRKKVKIVHSILHWKPNI